MSKNNIDSRVSSIVNGLIQIGLSAYWLWHFGQLLYAYHFHPMILYLFIYPDWTLILFILMAIIGVGIGFVVILQKVKIIRGYILIIGLFILGLIVNFLVF